MAYLLLLAHAALDNVVVYHFWHLSGYAQAGGLGRGARVFALAMVTSSVINTSHELFHTEPMVNRVVAWLTLLRNFKPFYYLSHIYHHHRLVGTTEDPVCAPRGQSFYRYLLTIFLHEPSYVFKAHTG